ncbi:hypothetical protein BCR36DRAFT_410089 [Piromyces finnis]|uniref:Uncharacterized protein n=1 Tax=Piromyces finnis TaxID=1754191 RepID=A0A1Y1VH60_9FUNG|nr:hypothetical protein BCR36DRAFT_410089 [Piromyces finnis]|eukprot:ORX56058.1 hypothetical protein BCR36DRAFT_410089 [Piromyces finnis]
MKQLRELHLEKLRAMVRISAEIDPERVKKPTISSLKSKSILDKDRLFIINGYFDKQIMKDKRIRVTEALQREGLLHSDYAKLVISQLTETSNKYRNKSEIPFN